MITILFLIGRSECNLLSSFIVRCIFLSVSVELTMSQCIRIIVVLFLFLVFCFLISLLTISCRFWSWKIGLRVSRWSHDSITRWLLSFLWVIGLNGSCVGLMRLISIIYSVGVFDFIFQIFISFAFLKRNWEESEEKEWDKKKLKFAQNIHI